MAQTQSDVAREVERLRAERRPHDALHQAVHGDQRRGVAGTGRGLRQGEVAERPHGDAPELLTDQPRVGVEDRDDGGPGHHPVRQIQRIRIDVRQPLGQPDHVVAHRAE